MWKTLLALLAIPVAAGAFADELELTVYNQDLALVKEVRTLILERGVQEHAFTGVPERLLPETVHFLSRTDPEGTVVLEQNYRYDLLDRASLLERYRGREVEALVDGAWETVRLLAPGNPSAEQQPLGRILEVDGAIHIEGFILPSLPEGLLLEPTLVWLLDARRGGRHETELSYLTEGLGWRADYVAVVDRENRLDLTGWVTLDNRSGRDYENARLKLVAGDVHRVTPAPAAWRDKGERAVNLAAEAVRGFQQEQFFEYHLYTLQRSTTVRDREQKQVELLSEADIAAQRRYRFSSWLSQEDREPRAVDVVLEFSNQEGEGPGIPLPKGTVRVYQADADGRLQFAGEDEIAHTPEGERVRLKLGSAFDLRGEHRLLSTNRLGERTVEQTVQVVLRNHKDEAVTITVQEEMPAWREWRVLRCSHDREVVSARRLEIPVRVAADEEVTVEYVVRLE
ncbi:MAG: DUF4139 domain-containing protein [Candidatus Krumholzibacteriota bacterium]|nr:DUF4139 domain-containing protein [Candidatus Krumholzibacteriota bacterium]